MEVPDNPAGRRRFSSWRMWRRIVIGLAWTATIIALLYGIENWRCRRAWTNYASATEARGEHLDYAYYIPKAVSDDRNFFMAGLLPETMFNPDPQKYYAFKDNFSWASQHIDPPDSGSSEFHLIDLATWEKALEAASAQSADARATGGRIHGPLFDRATDPDPAARLAAAPGVLRGLQDIAPILDELQAASSRPEARFPLDYGAENPAMITLPHLYPLRQFSARLRLRASAELALGRTDDAFSDLKLMFYLSDTVRNEPFLISSLVRVGLLTTQIQVIREGLAAHRWSDTQLEQIQQRLLSFDWVTDIQRCIAAERAREIAIGEYYGSSGNFGQMLAYLSLLEAQGNRGDVSGWNGIPGQILSHIMPRGWYHLEQINTADYSTALFQSVFDPADKRIFPHQSEANIALVEPSIPKSDFDGFLRHRSMIRAWIAETNTSLVRLFASAQCRSDEAAIACGLERYRLAKGSYPTDLDSLVPTFIPALPHDALTGEPYRYRRDSAELYTLYSVGWNLKDDGGTPGSRPFGKDGDWVW